MLLSFNVEKQIITRTDTEKVVTNSMNYLYAQFTFTDEWVGEKTAVFKGKHGTYNAILDAENKCLVPWEILTEAMFDVSVFCGDLITANAVKIFTIQSGYEIGDESRIPTPEIYIQVINRLNEIEAEIDPEAIQRTVDEYLADKEIVTEEDVEQIVADYIEEHKEELRGPKGDTGETGPQGPKGDDGANGVGVPTGGTTGQVLTKKSNNNYDTEWKNLVDVSRYNVLEYGLVADGVTDNSTAFADLIEQIPDAETTPVVIYFPAGRYLFTQPITINRGGFTLIGETVTNKEYAGGQNGLGWANPDSVLIYDGAANTTFIKGSNRTWFLNLYGLHFDCPNGFNMTQNTDAFDGTLPYVFFKTSVSKDGIIGVGKTNGLSVDKCVFSGFSGAGFEAPIHTIINETSFFNCKIGADVEYDTLVKDCWFNYCELAVNIRPSDDTEWSWSTFMIADTWIDQGKRALYSTARETTIVASNIYFDMMDEAAIYCTQRLINSRIEGFITRAGMMYAGISDANRTIAIAPYSDAIVADNILYTKIDVTSLKRSIGQGKNKDALCASRLVSSLSGRMTRSDIKDYSIVFADVYDATMITQFYDTNFHVRDKECTNADARIFTYAKIYYNAGSPIGVVKPLSQTCFCIDTTSGVWYRSTGTNNTDWVVVADKLPTAPTTNGTYTLQATVNNGTVTYAWV